LVFLRSLEGVVKGKYVFFSGRFARPADNVFSLPPEDVFSSATSFAKPVRLLICHTSRALPEAKFHNYFTVSQKTYLNGKKIMDSLEDRFFIGFKPELL